MIKTTIAASSTLIKLGVHFDAGSLAGTGQFVGMGRLNNIEASLLAADVEEGRADYIVYSYATPIAWRYTNGEWHLSNQRHSVTTSKHQSRVRRAVSAD